MKKKLLMLFLGIFLTAIQVMAQQVTVTGKITSAEDGQPIPGASVKIKGTAIAVQTSPVGTYSIKTKAGDILQFVYLGLLTQEKTVGSSTVINVVLKEDANSLNEVTITTAYNIERNIKSLGYSTPTVKGDEVTQTGRENFINGLAGRVPGLFVNPTSGDPGASSQIILRGIVSMTGDNQPLIVLDGVPIDNSVVSQGNTAAGGTSRAQDYTNRASDINPADIESYVILKGPEASALYGNLGASGAIVITTKKAKAGKSTVSYNGSVRTEAVNNAPEVQTVYGQGDANGIFNGGSYNFFGPKYAEGLKIYDNVDAFFKVGIAQKHNVVVEGGKEGLSYRWSNEFTNNKGTIPTTQYKRFVSSIVGVIPVSNQIKVTTRFSYTNAYNRKANRGVQGYLMGLLRFPSRFDVTNWIDPLGNRVTTTGTIYAESDNPFWDVNKNLNEDKTDAILGNANISYKPTNWLSVTAILGTNLSTTTGLSVYHTQSYLGSGSAGTPTGGTISTYEQLNRRFDGSLVASASHKFGKFNNTYIIGGNFSDVNNRTNSAKGQNMFDPDFYSINNTLPTTQAARYIENRYRNMGVFAQAVLGYQSLFYLTLTGRMDGASRLMADFETSKPFFAYPSASFAFNFTELDAFKKLSWLSDGKLRASFGLTGKEPYKLYALKTRLLTVQSTGGGFNYDLANGGNEDLKPEKTRSFETGFELGFLKNRLSLDFTYYELKSSEQIIAARTSYGTGFAIVLLNGGEVINKGFEVQMKGSPLRSKNFNWDMTLNYTRNRGTVLSIADELPELYDSDTWIANGIRSAVFPGSSTLAIGGWKNQRNKYGDVLINPATGLPILGSDQEWPVIGDRTPNFTLGFQNSLNYKNITLSFLFDLRIGGDVYNQTQYELYRRGLSTKTLDREVPRVVTGVLKDGLENTDNPTKNTILVTPSANTNYYTSTTAGIAPDQFVEHNVKALRLRDVTLAYELPKSLLARTKFISSLGAFVTFTDVFLITNYSGTDPDANSNNPSLGGAGGYGIDYGSMGRPLGVNIGLRFKL